MTIRNTLANPGFQGSAGPIDRRSSSGGSSPANRGHPPPLPNAIPLVDLLCRASQEGRGPGGPALESMWGSPQPRPLLELVDAALAATEEVQVARERDNVQFRPHDSAGD